MFNSLETHVYCLFDKVLNSYSNLIAVSGPTAKRIFEEMANNTSSDYYRSTDNYTVCHLGLWSITRPGVPITTCTPLFNDFICLSIGCPP